MGGGRRRVSVVRGFVAITKVENGLAMQSHAVNVEGRPTVTISTTLRATTTAALAGPIVAIEVITSKRRKPKLIPGRPPA